MPLSSRATLIALATVALAAPAAGASSSSGGEHGATATAAKCTNATIAGRRTCLSVGQTCKRKYQKQYLRAGFSCAKTASGKYRLVSKRQAF
jgi:uncharacterized membrane protein